MTVVAVNEQSSIDKQMNMVREKQLCFSSPMYRLVDYYSCIGGIEVQNIYILNPSVGERERLQASEERQCYSLSG